MVVHPRQILDAISKGQDIDVSHASISGHLDIQEVSKHLQQDQDARLVLSGNIRIQYCEIKGDLELGHARIEGSLNLCNCHIRGHSSLESSCVIKDAFLDSVTFEGAVVFSSTHFKGIACFDSCVFQAGCTLTSAIFESRITFRGATFKGVVDFNDVSMQRPANFSEVTYNENTALLAIWNTLLRWPLASFVKVATGGRKTIPTLPPTDFRGINTAVVVDGASNAYLKRYLEDEQWIQSWRRQSLSRRLLFYYWEATSHCGRSLSLWMLWVVVIASIFGVIYASYPVPRWLPAPLANAATWAQAKVGFSSGGREMTPFSPYYFSVVTLATLGYGDITPQNLAGEIWVTAEVLLGYLMLGGLVSIFANKFARRS